ncbi:MAG: Acetyltransferase, GNAT family [Firmicutes bacterium]|nr:Acetyltransferase, GNAT family [Bacillota bacterium]MDI6706798.1 GNAT family protein [Bacillota bacterium]
MKYFKKIVGERLFLSPIDPEDAELYANWINDLEVSIYLTSAPDIYSLARERETLERISKEGYVFAIVDSEKEQAIGNCGVMNVDLINRKAELGIFIGAKGYWGKGYGKEAIELLLDFSFNILNLNSVMLIVKEFNKRAINCYEKCGFKLIGKRREAVILGSQKYDEYYMDILATEFKKNSIPRIIENH